MRLGAFEFREVWMVDFEFTAPRGECPTPVCMVASELGSGKTIKLFQEELQQLKTAPYPTLSDTLFVAYFASAEIGCHLGLGWPLPQNVLDLYVEFRNLTNGLGTPAGAGVLGALVYFGLDAMDGIEKETMRQLAMRGGPYTEDEKQALLAYCESDVIALRKLLGAMLPQIDLPRALLRGRYMKAVGHMEKTGVPIDSQSLVTLRENWDGIQDELIHRVDANYGVYEDRTFKANKFAQWLLLQQIPWPQLESGALALDEDTFRCMEKLHPSIASLRQLRVTLSQMRLAELAVGADARNRTLLSPFRARTSRNQPSNTGFIFGPAVWLRSLIKPEPGTALIYMDWEQQEFGIAAALSGDVAMQDAYTTGDPYLAFAKQAGAAPMDATKASHTHVRNQFKECALAVQYGMEADSLARRIGQRVIQARELLRLHHETYRGFWKWSDAALDCAMLQGVLPTVFGWNIHVGADTNPRMIRNFSMQANGAEMLRLACCLATESGIRVCAPVHDAILIEATLSQLDDAICETQVAMAKASAIVLGGFQLRSDAMVIRYPGRYEDERGKEMWETVWQVINEMPPQTCAPVHIVGVH